MFSEQVELIAVIVVVVNAVSGQYCFMTAGSKKCGFCGSVGSSFCLSLSSLLLFA